MSNLKMEAVLAFVKENAIYGDPQSVLDTIDSYAMDGSLDQKRFLMNIGPEKGKILVDTIKKNKSKKILELGSFLGYSAVLIGMSIDDDGELISIDPDPNSIAIASQLVEFAGLSSKVSFIKGKAEHAINDLDRSFDLIFIDHAKKRYFPDLLLLESSGLVKKDTIIFADNVGLFKSDMTEYFKHVRDSNFYTSSNIGSKLEYRDSIYDAVEISVRIKD
jgi:catechol O-methyltransferase